MLNPNYSFLHLHKRSINKRVWFAASVYFTHSGKNFKTRSTMCNNTRVLVRTFVCNANILNVQKITYFG